MNEARDAKFVDEDRGRMAIVKDERQSQAVWTCVVGGVGLDRTKQCLVQVERIVEIGLDVS